MPWPAAPSSWGVAPGLNTGDGASEAVLDPVELAQYLAPSSQVIFPVTLSVVSPKTMIRIMPRRDGTGARVCIGEVNDSENGVSSQAEVTRMPPETVLALAVDVRSHRMTQPRVGPSSRRWTAPSLRWFRAQVARSVWVFARVNSIPQCKRFDTM